jgi:predicted MFS family arabinose efflux permease
MIAAVSGIISMFFWISSVYLIVLIGMIFRSIVDSCIVGTDTALLYDTLKQLKREKDYTKHNASRYALAMFGFGIAAILASIIPKHGEYTYHFMLTSLAFLGALIISWTLHEPKHYRRVSRTSLAHLGHAFRVIRDHKQLRKIVTYTFVVSGSLIILTYFQFFMRESGIPVQHFGLVYAVMGGISAIAAYMGLRVENKIGEKAMLLLMPSLFAIGALLFIFGNGPLYIIAALVAVEIFLGFQGAVLNTYTQRHVDSAYRSTVESLTSVYGSAYKAIMYLCMGVLADALSIQAAMILLLIVTAFLITPPLYLMTKASQ